MCALKWEGGIGFQNFLSFNHALLAKQVWRLMTPSTPMWVKLLKSQYYPKSSFMSAKKEHVPLGFGLVCVRLGASWREVLSRLLVIGILRGSRETCGCQAYQSHAPH
ncbi:hypothetical protein LINPERPRIM_LOCUS35410 [Linum perenne]